MSQIKNVSKTKDSHLLKIKRFLAFFRKMKIVDLREHLKKCLIFVHFWFRLSSSNDFFQPILFRCSFRSYTLWNQSIFSKNFLSWEISHRRSKDGRNLSQKNYVTWNKQGVWTFEDVTETFDWRSKHNFLNECLKKMNEKFNRTLGVGLHKRFSRGWLTDKGD